MTKNILQIDAQIKKNFKKEFSNLSKYKKQLKSLQKSLLKDNLKPKIKKNFIEAKEELEEKILKIEEKRNLNFYLTETLPLVEEYKNILKKPIKIDFMGKLTKEDPQKKEIYLKYIDIALKYIDLDLEVNSNQKIKCNNCKNTKNFEIVDENIYICSKCYSEQMIIKHVSSFKDIDRVNISSQYMYDRKVHFKDGVNQYQGFYIIYIFNYTFQNLIENTKNLKLLIQNINKNKFENFKAKLF